MASYIRLEGLIQSTGQTELQRLEYYLDAHYTEKLSLDSVASALGVGRTKLCALAKELSGGGSLSKMITQRRISAAKDMLRKGDAPETTPVETQPVAAEKTQITVIAAQYGQLTADWWVGFEADFEAANETVDLVVDVVWAVPDLASARALYYNVDILEAAGVEVPTTWAELEAACAALKAATPVRIPIRIVKASPTATAKTYGPATRCSRPYDSDSSQSFSGTYSCPRIRSLAIRWLSSTCFTRMVYCL